MKNIYDNNSMWQYGDDMNVTYIINGTALMR